MPNDAQGSTHEERVAKLRDAILGARVESQWNLRNATEAMDLGFGGVLSIRFPSRHEKANTEESRTRPCDISWRGHSVEGWT
jgi:hypothetical protein